ncbi:MAG TPA: extensin family protein [Kofleriaceae bacterium]|nr:extensin family protein [Kofleriaceae bacterium]
MRRAIVLAAAVCAGAAYAESTTTTTSTHRSSKSKSKSKSRSRSRSRSKSHKTKHKHAHARMSVHASATIDHGHDDKPDHVDPLAKTRFTTPPDATDSPAYHYGSLSSEKCLAELDARKISYKRETARGVATPVRLTGPLHGVVFHGDMAEKDRANSPHEIADCALVLALDDFAAEILVPHDIVEVKHYSMWRPPPESWPADQIAKRHPGAVAIDAAHFVKKDGTVLKVLDDFHGAIDDPTCGPDAAPHPVTPEATELRAIVCETAAKRIFNVILTPDYNYEHRNHFHMEVTSGVKWFLLH